MSRQQAEAVLRRAQGPSVLQRPCTFSDVGPVVVQVLEGENAVAKNREIMGATNPANADAGTIRKDFAESIEANSVHGSDSARERRHRDRVLLRGLRDRRLTARPPETKKRPEQGRFS